MDEATRMRNIARRLLLEEERLASSVAIQKEKETANGRRLVSERKIELERLERKIFQTGKIQSRPEPEGAEDNAEEKQSSFQPVELLANQFKILKKATGGVTTDEVLERFESQKDTEKRLQLLREESENEKKQLEKKTEILTSKFEAFKFSEFKDSENCIGTIDNIKAQIDTNRERERVCRAKRMKYEEISDTLHKKLENVLMCLCPLAIPGKDALSVIQEIEKVMETFLRKIESDIYSKELTVQEIGFTISEEKWLPGPYSGLIRRTPLPQVGTSPAPAPAPPGSDDEEEVPSRNYLKRQAQLVVDAKSRRKNIRTQLPKRN